MALKDDYQRVANRSLEACDGVLSVNVQEKAAFLAYHAFESTGCALASHFNLPVGPRVRHDRKVQHFTNAARRIGLEHEVAGLSITLHNLRNLCLYPLENAQGAVELPETKITMAAATKLKKRVAGIVKRVGKVL